MKTITLLPLLHKQAENIGIHFQPSATLNNIIKKIKGIRWSSSHKCWYVPLSRENYSAIVALAGNKAIIDATGLKTFLQKRKLVVGSKQIAGEKNKTITAFAAAQPVSYANLQELETFTNLLQLKGYSQATIKTYKSEFFALLQILKNTPVKKLTTDEVKRYILYCINTLQLSENTIHSRLNALKFYFEKVLHREKFFVEIPRPKKRAILPKVISEEKIITGLLQIENIKHKALLLLAYSAGLRVSEVIALKITDIDSDRMQIIVTNAKGKKTVFVP